MRKPPTQEDMANFTFRLGYVTAALTEPKMRAYLIERVWAAEYLDIAHRALMEVADLAFYRAMPVKQPDA